MFTGLSQTHRTVLKENNYRSGFAPLLNKHNKRYDFENGGLAWYLPLRWPFKEEKEGVMKPFLPAAKRHGQAEVQVEKKRGNFILDC